MSIDIEHRAHNLIFFKSQVLMIFVPPGVLVYNCSNIMWGLTTNTAKFIRQISMLKSRLEPRRLCFTNWWFGFIKITMMYVKMIWTDLCLTPKSIFLIYIKVNFQYIHSSLLKENNQWWRNWKANCPVSSKELSYSTQKYLEL